MTFEHLKEVREQVLWRSKNKVLRQESHASICLTKSGWWNVAEAGEAEGKTVGDGIR